MNGTTDHRAVLVDMAEAIRVCAVDVWDATPMGAPARSRWAFVEPADFCCGAITVLYQGTSPVGPTAGRGCEPWLFSTDWRLDVSRPCPPGLGSVYNIVPDPAAEREADTLLAFDNAVMYQDFAPAVQKAATLAVRHAGFLVMSCVSFRPGRITSYNAGDCVSTRFDFTLGLSA